MIFTAMFCLVFQSTYGGQDDPGAEKIKDRLEQFNSFVRPQKVYLHLDKSEYHAGETIWFKAYLMDGISHLPFSDTSNIYVELINSDGTAMEIRILLAEEGYAAGEMELSVNLPDGNYVVRAYTDWMRNFDNDRFFTRYLYISNPRYKNMIPRLDVWKNRWFNWRLERKTNDYQVEFFPEGGNLIEGVLNRVAVKVADMVGHGQDATIEIIDDNREVIAEFQTSFNGIGVFDIKPEKDNSYQARVSVNGDRFRNFDLPSALVEGYALRVDKEDNQLKVRIVSSVDPGNPLYTENLILIGHTRGKPHIGRVFQLSDGRKDIVIDIESFPTGIAHFTIFTSNYIPVSERLLFIDRGDRLEIQARHISKEIDEEGFFDIQLAVRDEAGDPVEGSFSLSAVTGQSDNNRHEDDILSYLLLSSELKGVAGNIPAGLGSGPDAELIVDHLLLTHGWRRFDWDNVIAGELPDINYTADKGLTLDGRLVDPAKDEALSDYQVHLAVKSGHNDTLTTSTGRNGVFSFNRLFYEGPVSMELSARRLPGNYPPSMELNVREGRGLDYDHNLYTKKLNVTERGDDWSRTRGVSESPYVATPGSDVSPQIYGVPDQTIFIDHDISTETSLYQVLRNRAIGVSFDQGRIMIRGQSSFLLSSEPRFMVDGMFVSRDVFLGLYPREVERIEIFRGPSAAVFGLRGGTGVILAYTRRPGYSGFEDSMEFVMLGYHEPQEFYTDILSFYGPSVTEDRNLKTIHWDPNLMSGKDGMIDVRVPRSKGSGRIKLTVEGTGYEGGVGFAEIYVNIEE